MKTFTRTMQHMVTSIMQPCKKSKEGLAIKTAKAKQMTLPTRVSTFPKCKKRHRFEVSCTEADKEVCLSYGMGSCVLCKQLMRGVIASGFDMLSRYNQLKQTMQDVIALEPLGMSYRPVLWNFFNMHPIDPVALWW